MYRERTLNLKKYKQFKTIFHHIRVKKDNHKEISTLQHIKNEIWKSFSLYEFKSGILESYFREVSTYYTKINLKNSMKLILIFWCFSIALNTFFSPGKDISIFICMLSLFLVMISYMYTLQLTSYNKIINTTIFVLMVCFISNCLTQDSVFVLTETNFSPAIQINILMFALLPVSLSVALNIILINFSIITALTFMMILRKRAFQSVHHYMSGLELIKSLSDVPLFSKDLNLYRYIGAMIPFLLSILLISIYLHYMNNTRRRSAFWTLGEKVKTKRSIEVTMRHQLKFIEAVMPHVVKKEYWAHSEDIKTHKWIYIKAFDNVSILFADIVGFTKMSSNKTAFRVVLMLNDLFNKFDDLCNATNCEKLGTLGDCYYCVAGCPLPRADHAVCCIEMGLGICKIIELFNQIYSEDVNMRVGIHTGRVNAAIIGQKRFKFDVYSNDVIIANSMESSGEPGKVHISETCYNFVKNNYIVDLGQDIEIKKEEKQGIAGSLLKSFIIKTYFVDPKSSHFKMNLNESNKPKKEFKIFDLKHSSKSKFKHKIADSETDSIMKKEDHLRQSIEFIKDLRFDPDQQIKLFSILPINSFTMMFHDKELEWHFRNFNLEEMVDITFENMKSARFFDCIICTLHCILIIIEAFVLFPDIEYLSMIIMFLNTASFIILTILSGWYFQIIYKDLNTILKKMIHNILSNVVVKSLNSFFFQNSVTIMVIILFYDCAKLYTDYTYTISFFLLTFSSTFIVPLYFAAEYFIKLLNSTILFAVLVFVFGLNPCIGKTNEYPEMYIFPKYTCLGAQNDTHSMFVNRIRLGFIAQVLIVYLLSILLIREIERNVRLWFFISREAEISREETQIAKRNAENVLYNIIPKYVFDNLMEQYQGNMENFSFSYAVTIPRCAVIFASLSNFFSKYYREDYKGGENALKLLHQIIQIFDDLIEKPKYKDVEKIKNINDCYMVAAGLNTVETSKNQNEVSHLIALLYYSFDLIKSLNNFNKYYIFGSDKFEIKIGYNFGTVTAGIIGSTKPMYDIWGDTVNVASRMYSAGVTGKIQVPDYVETQLSDYFMFKYRGKIFVKGKGEMDTYIVTDTLNNNSDPKIVSNAFIPTKLF